MLFGDRSKGAVEAQEDMEGPRSLLRREGSQPEKATRHTAFFQLRESEEGKTMETVKGSVVAQGGAEVRGVNWKNTENF